VRVEGEVEDIDTRHDAPTSAWDLDVCTHGFILAVGSDRRGNEGEQITLLTKGFDIGDTAPERGVVGRVTIGNDAGSETIGSGDEVDEHFFFLSI
jgi:hypothetical protein